MVNKNYIFTVHFLSFSCSENVLPSGRFQEYFHLESEPEVSEQVYKCCFKYEEIWKLEITGFSLIQSILIGLMDFRDGYQEFEKYRKFG